MSSRPNNRLEIRGSQLEPMASQRRLPSLCQGPQICLGCGSRTRIMIVVEHGAQARAIGITEQMAMLPLAVGRKVRTESQDIGISTMVVAGETEADPDTARTELLFLMGNSTKWDLEAALVL